MIKDFDRKKVNAAKEDAEAHELSDDVTANIRQSYEIKYLEPLKLRRTQLQDQVKKRQEIVENEKI